MTSTNTTSTLISDPTQPYFLPGTPAAGTYAILGCAAPDGIGVTLIHKKEDGTNVRSEIRSSFTGAVKWGLGLAFPLSTLLNHAEIAARNLWKTKAERIEGLASVRQAALELAAANLVINRVKPDSRITLVFDQAEIYGWVCGGEEPSNPYLQALCDAIRHALMVKRVAATWQICPSIDPWNALRLRSGALAADGAKPVSEPTQHGLTCETADRPKLVNPTPQVIAGWTPCTPLPSLQLSAATGIALRALLGGCGEASRTINPARLSRIVQQEWLKVAVAPRAMTGLAAFREEISWPVVELCKLAAGLGRGIDLIRIPSTRKSPTGKFEVRVSDTPFKGMLMVWPIAFLRTLWAEARSGECPTEGLPAEAIVQLAKEVTPRPNTAAEVVALLAAATYAQSHGIQVAWVTR